MSELEEQQRLESAYVMRTFGRSPVCFVRGDGMYLYDDAGERYPDFLAGIGVVSAGHSEPSITAAVKEQLDSVVATSNYFYAPHRGEVARMLSDFVGSGTWRSFFANSGAEANEAAIKLARAWGAGEKDGAYRIITMNGSFHGRTYATMTATGQGRIHDGFGPLLEGFDYVEPGDTTALEAAITPETVAIFLEPIRGEAGVWPYPEGYLARARELCDEHDLLLILDEVQTGIFRCGTPYCYQTLDIEPDIFTLAKGIANGFPVGVCVARDGIARSFSPGMHGTTFGGSPLAMAAAQATLSFHVGEKSGENAVRVGSYLRRRLSELDFVEDLRGSGLMVGMNLMDDTAARMVELGLEEHVVFNAPGPRTLRFLPPLICTEEHVDELIDALVRVWKKIGD